MNAYLTFYFIHLILFRTFIAALLCSLHKTDPKYILRGQTFNFPEKSPLHFYYLKFWSNANPLDYPMTRADEECDLAMPTSSHLIFIPDTQSEKYPAIPFQTLYEICH